MKKLLTTLMAGTMALALSACGITTKSNVNNNTSDGSVLFINASQKKDGNTVKMSKEVLEGINYEQLDLVDYRINQLGQKLEGDQFNEVIDKMKNADTIVIGTPVYWHTMSGSLKTLIDRFNDLEDRGVLKGKKLYFFMQGTSPTEQAISSTEFIIERVASQSKMELVAMADNNKEVAEMNDKLREQLNK